MNLQRILPKALAAVLVAAALLCSQAQAAEPQPFVKGTFATLRAEHAGRPFIVHLWGLSCGPCLVELPQWGELVKQTRIPVILIHADRPDPRAIRRMQNVLAKSGLASLPIFAFADRFEDRLRFEIDPDWQGELPRTLLIDAKGAATALSGVADLTYVSAWMASQP